MAIRRGQEIYRLEVNGLSYNIYTSNDKSSDRTRVKEGANPWLKKEN
jgi:hypothetical protein